jgi:hypothetical protein
MDKSEYRKIELAKIVKAIQDSGFVDKQQLSAIQQTLLTPSDNIPAINRAVAGLSEEDEFALMCRLMGTTTHLVPLEQRPIIVEDYLIPDFLARFQPGCEPYGFSKKDSLGFRCFVEVKSTDKARFKIGGSRLRRLRGFADHFELPLIFAVRFLMFQQNAVWVIVDDADRSKTSLTIEITDWFSGIRHVLWNEYFYFPLPGLHFILVFDRNYDEQGITHLDYGAAREFRIIDEDKVTAFFDGEAILYSAFFEAFCLQEVKIQTRGPITYQRLVPSLAVCSLADMIYNFYRLPVDAKENPVHDASKMIAQLEGTPFDRNLISRIAQTLMDRGYLYIAGVGDKEEHLRKWHHYGGQK